MDATAPILPRRRPAPPCLSATCRLPLCPSAPRRSSLQIGHPPRPKTEDKGAC